MRMMCYYIHALTALHAGTGQGVGVIDLPIAREKSTGLPIVPGSGIKGVLRDEFRVDDAGGNDQQPDKDADKKSEEAKTYRHVLFGPDAKTAEGGGFAGALNIQDAQLLCLPVRSVYGVFAWVTCPFILQRYKRDLAELPTSQPPDIPSFDGFSASKEELPTYLTEKSKLRSNSNEVFLEDLNFLQSTEDDIDPLATHIAESIFPFDKKWKEFFRERFMIVPDNVFSFLAETATEVRARIRIEPETRTVADGQLWYEENLPAETLLWGILGCDRSRSKDHQKGAAQLMKHFRDEIGMEKCLQIGGNATVGRGRVRWIPGTEA